MAGMDIRRTAGQQQPVEPVEHHTDVDLRPHRRDQYRQTSCRIDHRTRISFVNPMEGPLVDGAKTGGNADEWHIADGHQAWTQGWYWRRPAANGSWYTNNSGSSATPNCALEIETAVILR